MNAASARNSNSVARNCVLAAGGRTGPLRTATLLRTSGLSQAHRQCAISLKRGPLTGSATGRVLYLADDGYTTHGALRQTETIVGSGTLDCLVWGWGGGPMMRWMLMLSFRLFR